MRISIRFVYTIVFFAIIATDTEFIQMGIVVDKIVISLGMATSILFYDKLTPFLRWWFFVLIAYSFFSIMESYYYYRTFFMYMHVFSKFMVYYLAFWVYGFYKRFDRITIEDIVLIICVSFFIAAATVNRGAFSIAAFSINQRMFASSSVLTLVIPVLYFFNKYFATRKIFFLGALLVILAFILFLQHRTVWVTTALALLINFVFMSKARVKVDGFSLIPIVIIGVFMSMTVTVYILSDREIMERISHSVEQIANPFGDDKDDEGSTTEWRYMQWTSYWPFVEQNFLFGMRLKGFELPVQFYNHNGVQAFEDGSGHHFHSYYMDRLFYQGILSFILFMLPAYGYLFYHFFSKKELSIEQLVLFCFCVACIFYGFSYINPFYYFGIMGYSLLKMEQDYTYTEN